MAWLEKHKLSGGWVVVSRLPVFGNTDSGKPKKYLGNVSKKEAEAEKAIATAREKEIKAGRVPVEKAVARTKTKTRTFEEFVNGYCDESKKSKRRPDGWVKGYLDWRKLAWPKGYEVVEIHIKKGLEYFGDLPIADDEESLVRWGEAWKDWYSDRAPVLKYNSLKGEWKDIKTALYRASAKGGSLEGDRWHLSPTSPGANLAVPTPTGAGKKKKRMFTDAELEGIYKADPVNADMWRFAAWTGLRRGELMNLKWSDIDLFNERAVVRVVSDEDRETKNGKSRSVPLNSFTREVRDRLKGRAGDGDYVFPRWHKRTYTGKFDKARKAAGIETGTLHGLRHTFISRAVNNGIPVHLAKLWAGHSKLETTLGYLDTPEGYEFIAIEELIKTERDNVVKLDNMRRAA